MALSDLAGTSSSTSGAIAPAMTAAGRPAARAASSTRATTLPVERRRVDLPLAGDHRRTRGQRVLEADRLGDDVEAGHEACAGGRQPTREPARRPGAGQAATSTPNASRRRASPCSRSASTVTSPAMRLSAGRTRRRVEEQRPHVARNDDLGAAQRPAERLERAEAAVDCRRAPDADDDAAAAGVECGGDELPGAVGRRGERVVAPHEDEAARTCHLDDRRPVREQPPPASTGAPSGPVTRASRSEPREASTMTSSVPSPPSARGARGRRAPSARRPGASQRPPPLP